MRQTVLSMLLGVSFAAVSIYPTIAATNERDAVKATQSTRSAEARKKADCDRQARAHHFGIHLVQRNRFLKRCMGTR
jgi:hypothetical protein